MELFINHPNTVCNQIDANIGNKAGEIKARYNLKTPDALQIASALATGCGAFLTNDKALKRVTEMKVLVLQELTIL